MFSKVSKPAQGSGPTEGAKASAKAGIPSIISPDLRVNGDLVCSGDIQVDGWIEGDIQSRNVVIGEGATVHGGIQAENVRVCGVVKGQIRADNVNLTRTARVTGDILHKSLSMEQGAFLEGMCKRIDAVATPQIEHRQTPRERFKDGDLKSGVSIAEPGASAGKAAVN